VTGRIAGSADPTETAVPGLRRYLKRRRLALLELPGGVGATTPHRIPRPLRTVATRLLGPRVTAYLRRRRSGR